MSCARRLRCPSGPLCGHRAIVEAYRQERQRQEALADDQSLGYATELAEWVRDHPLITFHQWLKGTRQQCQ